MLVILACISVTQAWAAVETTLVSVHAKGPAFKAARWLQLVAELLVLLTSFVIQSLLLAALEQYTEDVTAWFLLFTFAWELAKSGYESLKRLWLGTRVAAGRQAIEWGLHLLEKNKAASQQGDESRLMEDGGLSSSSQVPRFAICLIDLGRWLLGSQISELEIE